MIKLRYHHLLCINYFKGYGYDEDFINNMKKIKAKIYVHIVLIKLMINVNGKKRLKDMIII